jgi:hypothetical protein
MEEYLLINPELACIDKKQISIIIYWQVKVNWYINLESSARGRLMYGVEGSRIIPVGL